MKQDETEKDVKNKQQSQNIGDDKLDELAKMANSLGMPYVENIPKIDEEVLNIISKDVALQHKILVFERQKRKIKVAIVNPNNDIALNVLRFIAEEKRLEIELYLASQEIFDEMSKQYSGGTEKAIKEVMEILKDEDYEDTTETVHKKEGKVDDESIHSAPVAKLLNVIIEHAIDGNASDIHIEPIGKDYRARFRVDGVLHSSLDIPKGVGRAVISRVKILSNLKIDERRKPQDGRFSFKQEGRHTVDFRVSTLPVFDSEKVVMRLLDTGNKIIDFENMGIMGKGNEILLKNIQEPYGIILMTGPTGSGKSTTLYACLDSLNKEERNIVTLEDPVEYSIPGINQSQINPEIGYTFASGLRSILRQDPNIIMVGEIRDSETAELTIHAALTGHLVLSTLHTNSSLGAIPRLIDMGIENFLLASSLKVVAAQRLIRRICTECKQQAEDSEAMIRYVKEQIKDLPKEEIEKYGIDLSKEIHLYEGKGCKACENTGFKGRIAIFEAFEIDTGIKEIISEKESSELDIQAYAEKHGMIKIKQDGLLKVILGLTTLSEVERVTEGSKSVGGAVEDDKG